MVLSIPKAGILRNSSRILHYIKNIVKHKRNNSVVQNTVYDIILQKKEKLSVKDETHENVDDELDDDKRYELNKICIDQNK